MKDSIIKIVIITLCFTALYKLTIGKDVNELLNEIRYFKSEYIALKNLLNLNDQNFVKELKKKIKLEVLQGDIKPNTKK